VGKILGSNWDCPALVANPTRRRRKNDVQQTDLWRAVAIQMQRQGPFDFAPNWLGTFEIRRTSILSHFLYGIPTVEGMSGSREKK
jgi:hypothetical protein